MSSQQPTLTAINRLKTNPSNPRAIRKDQLDKLVKSLREFPEMLEARPIVVNPDFVVLGGNMRLKAAQLAGLTEVPVYVATWEEAKHKEFIIKDNLAFGEWDWDMLANEWDAEELDDWGLDVPLLEEETEGLTDPDEVPEVPEEPTTKPGDLWILGDHRLLCGDSTKAEDVERLMDGKKADMVFTDPPYGIAYSSSKFDGNTKGLTNKRNKAEMIMGDESEFDPSFLLQLFKSAKEVFVWGYQYYPHKLGRGGIIVWNKKREEEQDCPHGDFELCWSKNERNKMCWLRWGGFNNKENGEKRLHTTQKPVDLVEWFFDNWGNGLTVVADLFGGSGTTLIACERTKRHCRMMELDPKYCDVIVKRWEDFTGKKAELWKQ